MAPELFKSLILISDAIAFPTLLMLLSETNLVLIKLTLSLSLFITSSRNTLASRGLASIV